MSLKWVKLRCREVGRWGSKTTWMPSFDTSQSFKRNGTVRAMGKVSLSNPSAAKPGQRQTIKLNPRARKKSLRTQPWPWVKWSQRPPHPSSWVGQGGGGGQISGASDGTSCSSKCPKLSRLTPWPSRATSKQFSLVLEQYLEQLSSTLMNDLEDNFLVHRSDLLWRSRTT